MKRPEHYRHSVGQNSFNLVWKPESAKDPFKFETMRKHCEQFLREIAAANKMEIYKLQVEPDHIHMFVGLPPTLSISMALQLLKRGSSY